MGTITRNAANNFTTGGVILPAAINDTSVASISELENAATGGALTLISEQTASSSASISFTTGIDSTYPIYKFEFINIHPSTDNTNFQINFRDGGSSFDAIKTTTFFETYHYESDASNLRYDANNLDLAQSTSAQTISNFVSNDNDASTNGTVYLYSPSSTTFVKHFISVSQGSWSGSASINNYVAGYCNTTVAIDGVQFAMSSGNIDSGTIKLYGISGS